ncbi:type II CAAX endopeptidase family protein [Dysgonomonas sp. ZJ709]|uniref:type II CAAX endopeptidase family protein n=1 Tax=Dysgonomonas sp. ZJ709 TaxID=2709797 RepID=UPI0013E9F504|nr:type II CAAX endopeptidase family protein [Dysgonomonas sp. ZJ709]
MKSIIKKYPIVAFYVTCLLFLITIGLANMLLFPTSFDYILILPQWSPALAAILVVLVQGGRINVKSLLMKIAFKNLNMRWLLIALVIPLIICCLSYVIFSFVEHKQLVIPVLCRSGGNYSICLLAAIFGSYGEEIGWRGFMLPQLLKKYSLFLSSLIVGVFWGLWHFKFQTPLITVFYLISVIEFSLIISWLCSKTKGNILVAIVFHTILNMCSLLLFENMLSDKVHGLYMQELLYGIYALLFAVPSVLITKEMVRTENRDSG